MNMTSTHTAKISSITRTLVCGVPAHSSRSSGICAVRLRLYVWRAT